MTNLTCASPEISEAGVLVRFLACIKVDVPAGLHSNLLINETEIGMPFALVPIHTFTSRLGVAATSYRVCVLRCCTQQANQFRRTAYSGVSRPDWGSHGCTERCSDIICAPAVDFPVWSDVQFVEDVQVASHVFWDHMSVRRSEQTVGIPVQRKMPQPLKT